MSSNSNTPAALMHGILVVKEKIQLTPHYIRMILTGNDLQNFSLAQVGDNNKIIIPPPGTILTDLQGRPPGPMRTYTLRALDLSKQEMTIDFVAHGDEGPASGWAIHCQTGDQLVVLMKQKNKQLYKPSDWYLLAGDHTALPVISVILEQLPEDAVGQVIVEVFEEDDKISLTKPENMEVQWVFNDHPGEKVLLPEAFQAVELPEQGTRFLFSAGEYQSVRQIQEWIRKDSSIRRDEWQSFSYWKYGQAEDASAGNRKDLNKR